MLKFSDKVLEQKINYVSELCQKLLVIKSLTINFDSKDNKL